MEKLRTDAPVRKPAGGVAEVMLTPVSNICEISFDASGLGCQPPRFTDASLCLSLPLCEGRSSFTERTEGTVGASLMRHMLTLALDPSDAATLAADPSVAALENEGAAALIRMESGRLLCAGYSLRFGAEQPMRLLETEHASGSGLRERPLLLLRFGSADTSPAAEIDEGRSMEHTPITEIQI